MIKTIVHFSDLHIRLFKDHDLYRLVLQDAINQWKTLKPCRIVFTGDLVHSKNQLTPELIEMVSWVLNECAQIAPIVIIPGNHDALIGNTERLDALTPIIDSIRNNNVIYYKDRGMKTKTLVGVYIHNSKTTFHQTLILQPELKSDYFTGQYKE